VGGVDFGEQDQAQSVEQKMSLSSRHLLANIVATNSA
jgi:hypothetical protein